MSNNQDNSSLYKIHTRYIIGILVVAIIGLLTVNWAQIKELEKYITFALTISSLVLALLAIIYAFYSNSGMSQNIGLLQLTSKDVTQSAAELSNATKVLNKQLESIPSMIAQVSDKVDKSHHEVLATLSRQSLKTHAQEGKLLTAEQLESFFEFSSITGLLAVYAIILSQSKKRPINADVLWPTVKYASAVYQQGFLIAVSSFGLFSHNHDNGLWTISYVHPNLQTVFSRAKIEKRIRDFAPQLIDENADQLVADSLGKIDEYFAIKLKD